MLERAITFDDVYLLPGYNDLPSRRDVSLRVNLNTDFCMDIPIFSSNMDTITEDDMAVEMYRLGGLGILHRFCSIDDNVAMFNKADSCICGVSVGISDVEKERAAALVEAGARVLCVDVAHGHSKFVGKMVQWIKRNLHNVDFIIAGNVATHAGADYLASCGADAIKIGIGPGSACTTRINTGVGVPQITAIMNCRRVERFLIADGGIRSPGDAAKALAAGADAVMLGGQLAGTSFTPGDVFGYDAEGVLERNPIVKDGNCYKEFRGMASKEAQEDFMGSMSEWKTHEGVATKVPYKGSTSRVINHFAGGIRSAFTYVGARNIEEFHRKAEFVQISSAGRAEGEAHIKNGTNN